MKDAALGESHHDGVRLAVIRQRHAQIEEWES